MNATLIEQRKKIFYEFLVQNGALFNYFNCMLSFKFKNIKTIDEVVKELHPVNYFNLVIDFGTDLDYWKQVDRKWQKQIHNDRSNDWLSSPKK